MSPIALQFIELAPSTNNNFGFRINLNEMVVNQSGFNWNGFDFAVYDTNRVYEDEEGGSHPAYAHIHPSFGPLTAPPFTNVTPSGFGGGGFRHVELSDGIFTNGTANSWTGIALHQFEEVGAQRPFTLVQTPIPEPNALWLVSAGVIGFVIIRRRRS